MELRFEDIADRDDPVVQRFIARIPEARERHRARGLTDDESWETLQDLPRHARLDRLLHGSPGLRKNWWVELAFSGRLFQLGRLQYEPRDGYLNLHVPEEGGPLTPAAVDASLARARDVFPEYREARITSWLLDPQLVQLLGDDANIVRFAQRFEVIADAGEEERLLEFVFHTLDCLKAVESLPQETRLQRAIVELMRSGGRLRTTVGRLEL